ncbi:hypothetical protein HY085_01985, partial [Candidatus Gottesmanbacteria bacterium]|nr:hypothetical protein [Candidatus Gottesmanbacteria bacterium]
MAVLLTVVHWGPAIQALRSSPRGEASTLNLEKHLMPVSHLITYLSPDFFGHPANNTYFGKSEYKEGMLYIGLLPLVFALLIWRTKDSRTSFFKILTLATLPLGFNLPGTQWFLSKIPLVSAFLPNRIFILTSFALCVLSAFGLEYWLRNREIAGKKLRRILWGIFLVLMIIVVGIVVVYFNEKIFLSWTKFSFFERGWERYLLLMLQAVRESLFLLLFIGVIFFRKNFAVGILSVLVLEQIIFANRYLYFSNPANLFPPHPVIEF